MEKTQLTNLFEVVKKAAANGEEAWCIDALYQLKSLRVTVELLASTRVRKGVRSLTKHRSEKIKNLASDVITVWKNIILKKSRIAPKKPQVEATKSWKSHIVRKTSCLKVLDSRVDNMPKCDNPMRNKIREQVLEGLCMVFKEEPKLDMMLQINTSDPVQVAVSLESTLFSKWGLSNNASRRKYRSLLFNIKDPKNPDFRRRVLVGEIKPEKVVMMNPLEMASDERRRENEEFEARSWWKRIIKRDEEGTTDQFRCGKCGQRKTIYHQLQTRSADEPMTTYITCQVCNNNWKI